jgi:outer membrane lipoprotein SlyB
MTTRQTSPIRAGMALAGLAGALLLGGCGSTPMPHDTAPVSSTPGTVYTSPSTVEYGTVSSVQLIERKQGIGAGAVIGGVVGAVIGNQVGSGTGRAVATGAGAVGGAVAGHEIQKRTGDGSHLVQYTLNMERGDQRVVNSETDLGLRVGQRVRLVDGALQAY